jgi:hypothetical protein
VEDLSNSFKFYQESNILIFEISLETSYRQWYNTLCSTYSETVFVLFCSPYLVYLLTVGVEVFFCVSLDHTQTQTTVDRTPLDEGSARRRNLYLTTHSTHKRQTSMRPVGFEPTIPAGARPQTYALDRAATGIGLWNCSPKLTRSYYYPCNLGLSVCDPLQPTCLILYESHIVSPSRPFCSAQSPQDSHRQITKDNLQR